MAQPNRLPPTLRHPSMGGFGTSSASSANSGLGSSSSTLVARINEKKAELENLRQLRDLSGALAAQMEALQERVSTLADGTECESS